ncbi:MAG TPA: type II toxin-antitoxin system RelE/ParE family toxin [Candidatus Didemnitutus sp.]|nr:type II toxin-antitoxin system RelE/ParE family toxin [Candidatus Didemnitutus sp.]
MNWQLVFSFRAEEDLAAAAVWYEGKRKGLGHEFVDEVVECLKDLGLHPLLAARKHPTKNLRWRYPRRFPYRVIYTVDEAKGSVVVLRVIHAAREDTGWRVKQ